MIYGTCVACKKGKAWVKKRTYNIPKYILKQNPQLASANGMTSDGVLCRKCFADIRQVTLGIPSNILKRLVLSVKRAIIK